MFSIVNRASFTDLGNKASKREDPKTLEKLRSHGMTAERWEERLQMAKDIEETIMYLKRDHNTVWSMTKVFDEVR
ncbi:uncharacterized protein Z518_07069 [Rhinocladiella mackenziei CBS 650.93]|uniref:Uncharacterized protein n=1 Tax=Rhinocladiella mackenziei CBS 650.93 TaxID=1442369 RepID=A0A0D2IJY2_9EURO|nr:uncharacterized protein Z518_07069 [Rhinocladiella mackenziei CBS 650.93]KIX03516.1 hypothetical protein Z518_07069 [Rhinocladiella mackenziei CBS 650.93]